jgi:DNA-directed RNA polymerase subunit L
MLMSYVFSPEVEFCGYSIPHPSEPLMNIRIQTYGSLGILSNLMAKLTIVRGHNCFGGFRKRVDGSYEPLRRGCQ